MSSFDDIIQVESISDSSYIGATSPDKAERMFGGLFIGQAMMACQRTTTLDRSLHSLHCYFLRPGDTSIPVQYEVNRVRDGRSFSHREAVAFQNGKELFRMLCSYAVTTPSHDYIGVNPPKVKAANDVTYTYSDFCRDQMPNPNYIRDVKRRPFDIRYINPPNGFGKSDHIENQLMWMRLSVDISDDWHTHDAGVGYLSDSTLIDHITLPHGKRWQDEDFEGTSLDHAMWFHKSVRADEWLLFDQKVEWTGDGRGLASGRIFTEDGTLAATCVQEGLMRFL